MPDDLIRNSGGFAPRPPLNPSHTQRMSGYKASRKTSVLILPTCLAVQCGLSLSIDALIVFSKVHAGVHRRDMVDVSVEWPSLVAGGTTREERTSVGKERDKKS